MLCFMDTVADCSSFCSQYGLHGEGNDAPFKLPPVPYMDIFSLFLSSPINLLVFYVSCYTVPSVVNTTEVYKWLFSL